jgi:gluconate 5-dehydrogenase
LSLVEVHGEEATSRERRKDLSNSGEGFVDTQAPASTSCGYGAFVKGPFDLSGRTALVTGGATGIGLGISRCLAEAGAKVVMAGRTEETLRSASEHLGCTFAVLDVREFEALPDRVAAIEATLGPIDILVNNAGNHLKKPAVDTTEEEFLNVIHTHVTGAFALTRAVARGMLERRRGSVLFTASMTSLMGLPLVVAYSAAKSAFLGMVRTLAVEFAPYRVRVNAVAPGFIRSAITERALGQDPERKAKVLGRTPMGSLGEAEDVGWAVVYLASDAAKFVTGVVLSVDGGFSIGF